MKLLGEVIAFVEQNEGATLDEVAAHFPDVERVKVRDALAQARCRKHLNRRGDRYVPSWESELYVPYPRVSCVWDLGKITQEKK